MDCNSNSSMDDSSSNSNNPHSNVQVRKKGKTLMGKYCSFTQLRRYNIVPIHWAKTKS